MTFKEYLQKTFRRGSFFVKFVKLFRLFQHSIYYFRRKKIGTYPSPPEDLTYVGYFDKNKLVHVKDEFEHYFSENNMYRGGKFVKMKPGIISLVVYEEKVLVRKVFTGIKKYNQFYNELICLDKLAHIDNVPKVHFVNYRNCEIYMDYIDGLNLLRCRKEQKEVVSEQNFYSVKDELLQILHQVHDAGVIMYDLRDANMMKLGNKYFLFDFADAMYFDLFFSRFNQFLKNREIRKLQYELFQLLDNSPLKEELQRTDEIIMSIKKFD